MIKHLWIVLLFPLLAFTGDWITYESLEGRFSISTPHHFMEKTLKSETAIGTLETYYFVYQPEGQIDAEGNMLYTLSYVDYPENSIHSDSTELLDDFFKTTIETSIKSVKGELRYDTPEKIKGFPGWLWRVDVADKAVIKTKTYLINNRLYTLQVVTIAENSLNKSVDRFMESFRLLQ